MSNTCIIFKRAGAGYFAVYVVTHSISLHTTQFSLTLMHQPLCVFSALPYVSLCPSFCCLYAYREPLSGAFAQCFNCRLHSGCVHVDVMSVTSHLHVK